MKRRTYQPEYPYTLLREAADQYRAEVFRDNEARGRFLVHIQPLVQHCVGRVVSEYSSYIMRNIEDIVSYVNIRLLSSWIPKYLSQSTARRWREAVKYFSLAVRGYTYNYLRDTYDPRLVPMADVTEAQRLFVDSVAERVDRDEVRASIDRVAREHLAMRRYPEAVIDVVPRLMEYLVWKEYDRTGEIPG